MNWIQWEEQDERDDEFTVYFGYFASERLYVIRTEDNGRSHRLSVRGKNGVILRLGRKISGRNALQMAKLKAEKDLIARGFCGEIWEIIRTYYDGNGDVIGRLTPDEFYKLPPPETPDE